ncbi:hypothetical protein PCASD_17614 [Puccinia coronata f. sp. avenae]|uniref:Pre-mRNA-splicing factor Syf1/CRNKL1-like C-terminal HAT-repeats domain-containing protein n=1 Tax=Puccinia coronata f. sp. avenae TaxID=200324 RepID=A0A2N5TV19_9BASI|nr:hypothetical protein PCASD_17614 [Puccinia coronata f. sp. avenae]
MERAWELFEQVLETCPEKFVKPIFLLYARLEESHGLAKRAMAVLERATKKVALTDRFQVYVYVLYRQGDQKLGMPATRLIYEKAINCLLNSQMAEMCLRFANLEQKLGEIDRARAIYAHSSQFCNPRTAPQFCEIYHNFEIQHGSKDTFREMLRIKRAVQASFNTETSYLAAKAAVAGTSATTTAAAGHFSQQPGDEVDPMSRLENAMMLVITWVGLQIKTTKSASAAKLSHHIGRLHHPGRGYISQANVALAMPRLHWLAMPRLHRLAMLILHCPIPSFHQAEPRLHQAQLKLRQAKPQLRRANPVLRQCNQMLHLPSPSLH